MGKIFKALEKAEKQDSANPNQTSTKRRTQVYVSKADKPDRHRPVVLPNTNPIVLEPKPTETSEEQPFVQSESNPPGKRMPPDLLPPVAKVNPVVDKPDATRGDSARSDSVRKGSTQVIDSTVAPATVPHAVNDTERMNSPKALNSASSGHTELAEAGVPITSQPLPAAIQEAVVEGHAGEEPEDKKRVNIRYSRTRIQPNDPAKLRDNRVLSLFEEIETSNQFKILRTQVLRKLKAINGNSILITSANPYEGKTFTSINLGVSIAKEFDRTVLIIDADIRRPTQQHTDFSTKFFSLNVDKGLTDYLEGEADIEEILINPGIDKLTLIPGGTPVDNSPELLNSTRMAKMIAEIKTRYPSDRLVIVDGPAMLHFPDAMILSRYVDGVLPVVEAEKTPAEDMKKLINHLQEVNILGLVFNKNKS